MPKAMKLAAPLLALALLSGCATGGVPSAAGTKLSSDAAVSGQITVWSWDVAATALKRLSKEYTKEHPGTTINVVDIGYDNAYDKMSVGLQANSGLPDVITVETDHMPAYIHQFPKAFTDLKPLIGADEAQFDPSKISASSSADGKLLSMPWDSGTVALYVRTDYFKAAGVDPSKLATWDDLITAGEEVKAATGHALISTDLSTGSLFQMLLQQQGQGIFTPDGAINLTSAAAVKALALIKTMNDKGLLDNVKDWDGRVTATKNGKSAVMPEAVWWIGTLTGEMPELANKITVVPLPAFTAGGTQTSNDGGSTLAIPTQAKNPQLAGSFVKFMLANKDNQVSMMKDEGLFPSYLPALDAPLFHAPQAYFGGEKVYELFAAQTPKIPSITYTSDNAKAGDTVSSAVVAAVLNHQDPAAALKSAAEQIATATGRKIAQQP
ncbi:ABC transporter substrate-binding protein [Arthrobacter sp. A2-55]|uniref:ABC transporter substrate-binding protein n=1 Tax=Arthrobacter sp. A2-55 TaxID=2897337 RepID=UPI0021CD7368|nr:sugar ABC transporter substrate-binding protein [Arthrobacter sp. A2-55]MCU6481354.1 sugar ABC transporter substrate-binding protein [Arthrobacter sp. A2-55]